MKFIFNNKYIILIFSFILILLAVGTEAYNLNTNRDIHAFKNRLHKMEEGVKTTLDNLNSKDKINEFIDTEGYREELTASSTVYIVYEGNELIYWSSNIVNVPDIFNNNFYKPILLKLNDGYYIKYLKSLHNFKIIGLIPVYKEHKTSNKYLINGFVSKLRLSQRATIGFDINNGVAIKNQNGKYLFSLNLEKQLNPDNRSIITSFIYLLAFLLLISFFLLKIRHSTLRNQVFLVLAFTIFLMVLRWAMLKYQVPHSFYSLQLFSPVFHASSYLFGSLGDYCLNAFFIFIFIYSISLFRFNRFLRYKNKLYSYLLILLLMVFCILDCIYVVYQVNSLVVNSSFSLQLHIGSGITIFTLWAYLGASIFISTILTLMKMIVSLSKEVMSILYFYLMWIGILATMALVCYIIGLNVYLILCFLAVLGILQGLFYVNSSRDLNYLFHILGLLFAALFLTYIINIYSSEKEQKIRATKAESMKDTNYPIETMLLETISGDLNKDDYLHNIFSDDPIANEDKIKDYMLKRYFYSYRSNYEINFEICTRSSLLELEPEVRRQNDCFQKFDKMLEGATHIGYSNFYALKARKKGVISYLGLILFFSKKYGEVHFYILLNMKPRKKDELGYPELLKRDQSLYDISSNYSIAKYRDNKLTYSSGNFDYYTSFLHLKHAKRTYNNLVIQNGYNHYIHNINDNYKIVVSDEVLSLYKRYIAFPYSLLLMFFIFLFVRMLENYPWTGFNPYSFRQQIKFAFISTITFVFLITLVTSLYYNYSRNKKSYTSEHKKKIHILRQELYNTIKNPNSLKSYTDKNIGKKLRALSRIIGADINIYDTRGVLLSTSQPKIFLDKLISRRMNYTVLNKIKKEQKLEITELEYIGNLEYSSVYVTLMNDKKKPIAYLHVPYFFQNTEFRNDMQDLSVAVLNINLLIIILTLIVVFIISQRITSPLILLKDKFSQIQWGKKNEIIQYDKYDEVKGLIDAYNDMVGKLEESTRLLAKTERESAWREMARQVAHEIKNPLTPMKLSLQFLQFKLDENPKQWRKLFDDTATVLLKEIDELAKIASEFSNFAQMPKAKKETIDLVEILQDLHTLYSKGSTEIHLKSNVDNAYVFVDKNMIHRVFVNIISNALQAIDNNPKGKIDINISKEVDNFLISIIDNGRGIDDNIKSRIFTPYFTTKNSGTGLGLALTKDIIKNMGGVITFESEKNVGTSFRVVLPEKK